MHFFPKNILKFKIIFKTNVNQFGYLIKSCGNHFKRKYQFLRVEELEKFKTVMSQNMMIFRN